VMWRLSLADWGTEACVQKIMDDLELRLRPLIGHVRDDAGMYLFLAQTENKALWTGNGAIRAAEAVFLGKRLGYPKGRVMAEIEAFRRTITGQIDPTKKVDDFLAHSWDRA
jgi:hypothetical protein